MSLKTELLPHQNQATEKMFPTRIGALFMEMGTGKTRTAIELIAKRQGKISNVIWFCPVSLKETIRAEILKHTDCKDEDIYLFNHKTNQRNMPDVSWYIIGIESMSASARLKLAANSIINDKSMVIVDESSYIKGHRAARTCWITDISARARYRLILTGTPISQGIVDLFAQMRFLSPKILGYNSFYAFAANHLEYSERYKGLIVRAHNTEHIAAKIKPYVYQVTKDECLNLPSKLYESRYFEMTREQREWYDYAKNKFLSIEHEDWDSIAIFRLFTALQQIVCGFWNESIEEKGKPKRFVFHEFLHNRVDVLMDVIEHIPKDKKVIIWAKFEYDLKQISMDIEEYYGKSYTLFYGKIKEKDRPKHIEEFRQDARFFISTQSCGGHGLTLNEAHYVIFYNNAFKYSDRLQAEDRNHRIGQNNSVTYIDIICDYSIDNRIDKALYSKGSVVRQFRDEVDRIKDEKGRIDPKSKDRFRKLIKEL